MSKTFRRFIASLLVAGLGVDSAGRLSDICILTSELGVGVRPDWRSDPNAEALAPRAGQFPGSMGNGKNGPAVEERRLEAETLRLEITTRHYDDEMLAVKIGRAYKAGDAETARRLGEVLVTRFRSLVRSQSRRIMTLFRPWGIEVDDFLVVAATGLFIAARDFKESKGVPFRSFARTVIFRRLLTEYGMHAGSPLHLSGSDRKDLSHLRKDMQKELGRHPNPWEWEDRVVEVFGPLGVLFLYLDLGNGSFSDPIGEDGGEERGDFIASPHNTEEEALRPIIGEESWRAIQTLLSGVERRVVQGYLDDLTMDEISARTGLKRKTVDNALQRVRRLKGDRIRSALGITSKPLTFREERDILRRWLEQWKAQNPDQHVLPVRPRQLLQITGLKMASEATVNIVNEAGLRTPNQRALKTSN